MTYAKFVDSENSFTDFPDGRLEEGDAAGREGEVVGEAVQALRRDLQKEGIWRYMIHIICDD